MKKLACVLALTSAFASVDALAWGYEGHRVVGSIAEKLIKGSNAEKQVQALLLPGETLESITNWADGAKGGVGYPAPTPEQAAYTAVNPKHEEYHYVNIPFQSAHYHAGHVGTSEHDIVQTLSQAIAVLQGKTGPGVNPHNFTPRQALLLIAHMTGDIHQPLHVGAAYVGKGGSFVVPQSRAEVDAVSIYDSRGGNSLLLDDDKLSLMSKAMIPGEDKPLPEGAKKWTDPSVPLVLGQHRGQLRDAPHHDQHAGRIRAEGPGRPGQIPQLRNLPGPSGQHDDRPDLLAVRVGERFAGRGQARV